jgi:SNF2 family DNA or RNA helicase
MSRLHDGDEDPLKFCTLYDALNKKCTSAALPIMMGKDMSKYDFLGTAEMRDVIERSVDDQLCDKWYAAEPSIKTPLLQHQKDAVAFIQSNKGTLLGDEMGLGKTLTALKVIIDLICAQIAYWRLATDVKNYDNCNKERLVANAARLSKPIDKEVLYKLQTTDISKPFSRVRVRGQPIMVVVPVAAIGEWICQIATHCEGVSVAFVNGHDTIDVFHDGIRRYTYPNGKTIKGPLYSKKLFEFDIIIATYDGLRSSMCVPEIRKAYSKFKPFNQAKRDATRAAILSYYSPVSTDADNIVDEWARPLVPLGNIKLMKENEVFYWLKYPLIVCDEAHKCNNPTSNLTQCILSLCYESCLCLTGTPSHNEIKEYGTLLIIMRTPMPFTPDDWKAIIYEQKKGFKQQLKGLEPAPPPVKSIRKINPFATIANLKVILHRYMLARKGKKLGVYKFDVHQVTIIHPFINPLEIAWNQFVLTTVKTRVAEVFKARQRVPKKRGRKRKVDIEAAAAAAAAKLALIEAPPVEEERTYSIYDQIVPSVAEEGEEEENNDDEDDDDDDEDKKSPSVVTAMEEDKSSAAQTPPAAEVPVAEFKAFEVQNALIRGKQCAVGAGIIPWSRILHDDPEALALMTSPDFGVNSTKSQMIKNMFTSGRINIHKEKVLIASFFVEYLSLLESMLTNELGVGCVVITGAIKSSEERKRLEHEFQNNDKIRVCLISLGVAQCITLTAAAILIFADTWFSNGPTLQCMGRISRMCQLSSLIRIIFMVIAHSVETHIHRMAWLKMETNEILMYDGDDHDPLPIIGMQNLDQLRQHLDNWTSDTVSNMLEITDEWAKKYGGEPMKLESREYTVTENQIAIMKRAVKALVRRGTETEITTAITEALSNIKDLE